MTDDSDSDRIVKAAMAGAIVSLFLLGPITFFALGFNLDDNLGTAVAIWFGWAVVLGLVFYQTGWPD